MLHFQNAPYTKARTSQTIKYSSLISKFKSQAGKRVQEKPSSQLRNPPPWGALLN